MTTLKIIGTQPHKSRSGLEKDDLIDVQVGLRDVPINKWPDLKKQLSALIGEPDEAGGQED